LNTNADADGFSADALVSGPSFPDIARSSGG
jgi:hypothetical protein